jgi:hypothetical protein
VKKLVAGSSAAWRRRCDRPASSASAPAPAVRYPNAANTSRLLERCSTSPCRTRRGASGLVGQRRRAVDSIFRTLDPVVLPGYSRAVVRVGDYLELLSECTYDGTRVR